MCTAERHIYTSYVRNTPPPSFHSPAAQQYFRTAADWTRRNPGASFHRVIGVPVREPGRSATRQWLRDHYEEMDGLAHYHARVVTTDSGVDAVNMAIIDDPAVLLLLTADGSFMSGHSLETKEAVNSFRASYRSWWASAEPLEDYAQRTGLLTPMPDGAVDTEPPRLGLPPAAARAPSDDARGPGCGRRISRAPPTATRPGARSSPLRPPAALFQGPKSPLKQR